MSLSDWAEARREANLEFGVDRLTVAQARKVKFFSFPVVSQEKLDEALLDFWVNWSPCRLLSFDTESSLQTGRLVYVIIANYLGDVLIFDIDHLFYGQNRTLIDALGNPFDEIMASSVLVGSAISSDQLKAESFLGCKLSTSCIDTADVAVLFGESLWPGKYKNRPGLGSLAYLSLGYDYKPYSTRKKYENRYFELPKKVYRGGWPSFRRPQCLYQWQKPAKPFDVFYMALDGIVPVFFIYDCFMYICGGDRSKEKLFSSAECKASWLASELSIGPASRSDSSASISVAPFAKFSGPSSFGAASNEKFCLNSKGDICYNPNYIEPLESLGLSSEEMEAVTSSFLTEPLYEDNLPAVRSLFEQECALLAAKEIENGYEEDVFGNPIVPTYCGSVASVEDGEVLQDFLGVATPETPGWIAFWKYTHDKFPTYVYAWYLSGMSFAKLGRGNPTKLVVKGLLAGYTVFKTWFDWKVAELSELEASLAGAPIHVADLDHVDEGVAVDEVENVATVDVPENKAKINSRKRKRPNRDRFRNAQKRRKVFSRDKPGRDGLIVSRRAKFMRRCMRCSGFHPSVDCQNMVVCQYQLCLDISGSHTTEVCPYLNGICCKCFVVGHAEESCEVSQDLKNQYLKQHGHVGICTRAWVVDQAWYRPPRPCKQ